MKAIHKIYKRYIEIKYKIYIYIRCIYGTYTGYLQETYTVYKHIYSESIDI